MAGLAALYVVETVFTVLALLAVALRLWARHLTKRELALNDWAAIGALIFNFGFAAAAYVGFNAGIGEHMSALKNPETQLVVVIKCLLALEALWAVVNVLVKMSILTLYLQIFRGKWFNIACYTTMGLSAVLLVAVLLEVGLLCRPFEYNWNKYIPGTCGNSTKAYEAVGILNLITDLTIIILPMPVLWRLQIPVAKKVALTFMFGVGILICVVSTLRILSLSVWQTSDFTYGMRQVAYWSLLEPTLGIINCCLPIMGPIISAATSSKLWTRGHPSQGKVSYGKGLSGKTNSRGGQNLEAGPFKRLDEPSYPMGPIPSGSNEITTSSNSTDFYDPRDDKAESYVHDTKALPAKLGIKVKQEWQVHHG